MKCPRCQNEINETDQYCPHCGHRIVHQDARELRQIKEAKYRQLSFIMNRLLNIFTLIAVIFAIIGIFGPVIGYSGNTTKLEIGGLYWFTYEGWVHLEDGIISIGPFYTTFALYIITFIAVMALGALAIARAINSLRRHEECHTIPHIIGLAVIYRVYTAFLYNFYYEYVSNTAGQFVTDAEWGSTLYTLAIPLFTIALIILLIMKAVLTGTSKKIIRQVFTLVASFSVLNMIESVYTVLGVQDITINERVVFGSLHYFDVARGMPIEPTITVLVAFIFGSILLVSSVALGIINIRNLVKKDSINRILFLILACINNVAVLALLINNIIFGNTANMIEGWYDNIFYLNEDLLLLFLTNLMALGLAIATFFIKEDKQVEDDGIIDQEVVEKIDE